MKDLQEKTPKTKKDRAKQDKGKPPSFSTSHYAIQECHLLEEKPEFLAQPCPCHFTKLSNSDNP